MNSTDDYVFHFTGAGALLSIVTKRELWATSIEYLNDRLEGQLPTRYLTSLADNPPRCLPGVNPSATHLEALKLSLNSDLVMYTVSFTEHCESLPQYQMYCPPSGGYAIGFLKSYLRSLHGKVVKCDYSEKNLAQWCREFATEFLTNAAAMDTGNISAEYLAAKINSEKPYVRRRVEAGLKFKSSEFEFENEHRLIVLGSPNLPGAPKRYRESPQQNAIIPYNIVTLPNDGTEVMLVRGPNREWSYAWKTLSNLAQAARAEDTKWTFKLLSTKESTFRV